MKLASWANGQPDGALIVVSRDGDRYIRPHVASLQVALEKWNEHLPMLNEVDARLARGEGKPLKPVHMAAPLPRAWQWLDGSAFRSHGELMERLFRTAPAAVDRPLMYQGLS